MKNRVIYRGIRWSLASPSSARPRRCLIPRRGLPRSGSAIRRLINIAVAYDQGVRDVSCGDKSVHQRSLRKCYSERWSVDYRAGVQAEGSSGGQEEGGCGRPQRPGAAAALLLLLSCWLLSGLVLWARCQGVTGS